MPSSHESHESVFTVIDALDRPHGGRVLKLRLQRGETPSVKELKGAELIATSPTGEERAVHVEGFALFGGRPSDERLARTGRIDINVGDEGTVSGRPVGIRWLVRVPVR